MGFLDWRIDESRPREPIRAYGDVSNRVDDVNWITARVAIWLLSRVDERVDGEELPRLWVVVAPNSRALLRATFGSTEPFTLAEWLESVLRVGGYYDPSSV